MSNSGHITKRKSNWFYIEHAIPIARGTTRHGACRHLRVTEVSVRTVANRRKSTENHHKLCRALRSGTDMVEFRRKPQWICKIVHRSSSRVFSFSERTPSRGSISDFLVSNCEGLPPRCSSTPSIAQTRSSRPCSSSSPASSSLSSRGLGSALSLSPFPIPSPSLL